MEKDVVTIGSITYTMKAKRALLKLGILAQPIKTETNGQKGCNYGLSFDKAQYYAVIGELKRLGISYEYRGSVQ